MLTVGAIATVASVTTVAVAVFVVAVHSKWMHVSGNGFVLLFRINFHFFYDDKTFGWHFVFGFEFGFICLRCPHLYTMKLAFYVLYSHYIRVTHHHISPITTKISTTEGKKMMEKSKWNKMSAAINSRRINRRTDGREIEICAFIPDAEISRNLLFRCAQ